MIVRPYIVKEIGNRFWRFQIGLQKDFNSERVQDLWVSFWRAEEDQSYFYPVTFPHMPKITIKWPFWAVPNAILNDKNLSMKAKWLFCYIQSKPWDWDFSSKRIALETSDWIDGIISWLSELENNWYLRRERKWDGRLEYFLFQDKEKEEKNESEEMPEREKPWKGKSLEGKIPRRENPFHNKTIVPTKKEYIQNKKYNVTFLEFWEIYPHSRRFKKEKCFSLFSKIKNQEDFLEKTKIWTQYWQAEKTNEKYIPHSSTYLNWDYHENPPKIHKKNPLTSESKNYLLWF